MQIKRLLVIALLVAVPIFTLFALSSRTDFISTLRALSSASLVLAFILSSVVLLLAHTLRAYKTKVLTDTVKVTSWRTHTRALFIGYLFNALLPLRVGEIIRALVAGKGVRMSATFLFGLILLERAVDGLFLGLLTLGLLLGTHIFSTPSIHHVVLPASLALISGTLAIISVLYLFRLQPAWLLRFCYRFTALFNETLRDSLRFKIWSLMYGMERVLRWRRLTRYLALSVVMWLLYISAIFPLAVHYLHRPTLNQAVGGSTISYLGISTPAGPSYIGSYQTFVQPYIDAQARTQLAKQFLITAWLLQILPAFLVGFIFVIRTHETLERPVVSDRLVTSDKLLRDVDISHDLGSFLDAFFTNNSLSRIMHRLEIDKNSKLIHYFKGGSDAITALVYENNRFVVRKITPLQYKYKLSSQYEWLKDKERTEHIVKVLNEETTDTYYKIDLEYNKSYTPFFDYIHSMPIANSKQILSHIFEHLFEKVYSPEAAKLRPKDLKDYIENRCLNKIRQAAEVHDEIRMLVSYDELTINGKRYKNIHVVINEIMANKELMKTLATYRKCSIHGDVTIDNILVSKEQNRFLLIDPNDNENEISGPVFDFGRMGESLLYGYEFLNRDDTKVTVTNDTIMFEHARSHNYAELERHMLKIAKKYLTAEEAFAVPFHTAMMYSRMMTHRVVINPANAAKYYATSVIAFNNFLNSVK